MPRLSRQVEAERAACRAYYDADPERGKARSRAYREANPDRARDYNRAYYAENRPRVRARAAVAYALRVGKLVREPCLFCDAEKVEAHHHSYAEADRLSVTWLCRRHHAIAHRLRDIGQVNH